MARSLRSHCVRTFTLESFLLFSYLLLYSHQYDLWLAGWMTEDPGGAYESGWFIGLQPGAADVVSC